MIGRQIARVGVRAQSFAGTASRRQAVLLQQQQQQQSRTFVSDAWGKEYVKERQHHLEHAGKTADLWRKVSYYIAVPFCVVLGVYIYGVESEHIHHRNHEIEENGGEVPLGPKYEYNDMRKKPMPWARDGQDNCLFYNPKVNRNITM